MLTYKEFKESMDDILGDMADLVQYIKNNIKHVYDIWTHREKLMELFVMIITAFKEFIAENPQDLPDDKQFEYLAKYVDELIEFKNPFFEAVDYLVLRLLFYGLDKLLDQIKSN
jgi:hypothetical protein